MIKFSKNKNIKGGLTLVELIFGIAFVSFIGIAVANFQESIFSSNDFLQRSLSAEAEARSVLRGLVSELRSMNYSGTGSYPIGLADENSIVFYSDINGDGTTERLRYFLDGEFFKVGVVYPEGSPVSYDVGSEQVKILVRGVASASNIFTYHGTDYNGENGALTFPVNIPLIRLVKIDIPLSMERGANSVPYSISSQVSLRNLKENL